MNDLTILYYTSNRISDEFARNIRFLIWRNSRQMGLIPNPALIPNPPEADLKAYATSDGPPIISVSQKPISFGHNICIGDIGSSVYNVYRQILIAAQEAQTQWVVCCEDDTLYAPEHFRWRPMDDSVFYYNMNRWWIEPEGVFRWRDRTGMCACICSRELLIDALTERFEKFPEPMTERKQYNGWGEPGRYDKNLGLIQRKAVYFQTNDPIVTFNHKDSLGGLRRTNPGDKLQNELFPWGDGKTLWSVIHG